MATGFQARGFAIAALVLCICACTPPEPPPPPGPGTLDAAVLAMRTGNGTALREHIGKGAGLAAHANELAKSLDTEAWLVALGAVEREYDLRRAVAAMRADDDEGLADALGFDPQALSRDILRGGGSIYVKRADARNFYESGPQAIALLDDLQAPGLPSGCRAMHVTLYGRLESRELRVRYGLSNRGVTNLEAAPELGRTEIAVPANARRYPDAVDALASVRGAAGLDVTSLSAERWYGAQFILLSESGDILRVLMGREGEWAVAELSLTTLSERLESLRDSRLNVIRRKAGDMLRLGGRWPRGLNDTNLQAQELTDPVRDPWAEFSANPEPGFELATGPDGQWCAASLHTTPNGRRAIAADGSFLWLD